MDASTLLFTRLRIYRRNYPRHSLLAATPPRVDPRDAFVSVNHASLAALPQGAKVGTSSQRRRAQLKALRPDIDAIEFRGNVDTRLRKLAEGQVEAILLATAGLERLGKTDWVREKLDPKNFCPAAGQGSLGIETRKEDAATIEAVAFLDHAPTRFAVTTERAALAALGGGCQVPIGIHCREGNAGGGGLLIDEVFAVVAVPETGAAVRVHHSAPRAGNDPVLLGRLIAKMLLDGGAGPLLETQGGAQQSARCRWLGGAYSLPEPCTRPASSATDSEHLVRRRWKFRFLRFDLQRVLNRSEQGSYANSTDYHWLILTSANTVQALGERAAALGIRFALPAHSKVAAVGDATAAAARKAGFTVTLVPETYVAESLAKGLTSLVTGRRVLLARAEIARDLIPEVLRRAGAEVDGGGRIPECHARRRAGTASRCSRGGNRCCDVHEFLQCERTSQRLRGPRESSFLSRGLRPFPWDRLPAEPCEN